MTLSPSDAQERPKKKRAPIPVDTEHSDEDGGEAEEGTPEMKEVSTGVMQIEGGDYFVRFKVDGQDINMGTYSMLEDAQAVVTIAERLAFRGLPGADIAYKVSS